MNILMYLCTVLALDLVVKGSTKQCGPLFLDPSAEEGPPNVTSAYWIDYAYQNELINISCKIRSNPEANVTWLFNGADIRSIPNKVDHFRVKTFDCGSLLIIAKAKTSDKGLFTCVAQNAKGFGNHTVKVDVIPPKVVIPSVTDLSIDTKDHKAYLGTTFNLSCTVNFNPSSNSIPLIAFVRHGKAVIDIPGKYENFPQATVITSLQTRKLSLKNVTIDEEGNWGCLGVHLGTKGNYKEIYVEIVPCPAGYYCPWNDSTKYECPYGTYSPSMSLQCTRCAGEYPSSKPKGYSGPAKSIQECPVKGSVQSPQTKTYLIVGISVVSIIFFLLLLGITIEFNKQCKRFLLKPISVNNLDSGPELVINDFLAIDSEQNLFTVRV